MKNAIPILLAALAAVCLAAGARAHDFRVQPDRYAVAAGETVRLRLFVGEAFDGLPFLRDPRHMKRFDVVGPDGRAAVPGERNRITVGRIGPLAPGAHVVGYQSTYTLLTLAADRFDSYLKKEGFDAVRALRAERGETGAPGREAYARSAKTVVVAAGAAAGHDAVLGLALELVPERAPDAVRAGEAMPVRLLLDGAPLAGAPVTAWARAAPDRPARARTDAAGRAELRLPHAGAWLVRAVHMRPAAPGRDADWESVWASLTFAVPDAIPDSGAASAAD